MWRACVAVITIDGELAKEEKLWLAERAKIVSFSKEQIQILETELQNPVDISTIVPLITDKKDLAFLLHQIRVLGNIDGNYDEAEKAAFKGVEKIVLKGLDLKGIQAEVETIEKESYHEDNLYKSNNKASTFESISNGFMKMLNKGDYNYPDED
jgi:hypothetical protein